MRPEDVATDAEAAQAEADRLTQDELRLYVECAQKLKPLMTGKLLEAEPLLQREGLGRFSFCFPKLSSCSLQDSELRT